MIVKVSGSNIYTNFRDKRIACFIHQRSVDSKLPIPFRTKSIETPIEEFGDLDSTMNKDWCLEQRIVNGEVELQKGDYIMMTSKSDIEEYGDRACGHMHYYDGEQLISVYTKQPYEDDEAYDKRKEQEKLEALKSQYGGDVNVQETKE